MKMARVTDHILGYGDEEVISTDVMKKLSPTDPLINFKFRLTLTIVFNRKAIVSKIIKDLVSHGVKKIVYLAENTLEITITFKLGKRNILNKFFNILRQYSNIIHTLCYELRAIIPSKNLNKLSLKTIKKILIDNNSVSIATIDNTYIWVCINNKKHKAILKFIEAKVINANILDPASLPQSLFIICKLGGNIEELINEINEKIENYKKLVIG